MTDEAEMRGIVEKHVVRPLMGENALQKNLTEIQETMQNSKHFLSTYSSMEFEDSPLTQQKQQAPEVVSALVKNSKTNVTWASKKLLGGLGQAGGYLFKGKKEEPKEEEVVVEKSNFGIEPEEDKLREFQTIEQINELIMKVSTSLATDKTNLSKWILGI